jgi:hypothetical protein
LVVDCLFGEALSPTTADYCHVGVSNESLFGAIDPAFNDLAVSIHKLDKVELGFGTKQMVESRISGTSGSKGGGQVKFNHIHA